MREWLLWRRVVGDDDASITLVVDDVAEEVTGVRVWNSTPLTFTVFFTFRNGQERDYVLQPATDVTFQLPNGQRKWIPYVHPELADAWMTDIAEWWVS